MSIQSEIDRLTTIKANLKVAINGASGATVGEVFGDYPGAITSGKAAIASAITEKGVATAADATFQQMAENVAAIETGGGIFATVKVKKGNDGSAQVYDFEQKQWISLSSSSYVSVKTPNFMVLHKGTDVYNSANIFAEGKIIGFNTGSNGSDGRCTYINPIEYPEGFSGFTNVEVSIYYSYM